MKERNEAATNRSHGGLPGWMRVVGSVLILGHLFAIMMSVMSAPSGPWPVGDGADWATPPHFAQAMTDPNGSFWPIPNYLRAIKMTHNYHFLSNRPRIASRLEVRLRDQSGAEITRVQVPDPNAPFAVRHRESLLAEGLADDQVVEPLPGEFVPPPGASIETSRIWELGQDGVASIQTVKQHLIPRDRDVFGPSAWSLLLARSYARHLCRLHHASSAEIIRTTKDFIPPDVLFADSPPSAASFDPMVMNFGVFDATE